MGQSREINFLKYGKFRPGILDRIKHVFRFKASNPAFYPINSLSWLNWGANVASCNPQAFITEGWNKSATLYSIVRKIAKTCALAPWQMYRVRDDQAFKRYKAMQMQRQNTSTLKNLHVARVKALEPISHPLNDLLDQPNPLQGASEYIEGLFTFKLLTGNAYEWGRTVSGGRLAELWLLPPQFIKIEGNGRWPVMPQQYLLMMGGEPISFRPEDVLHHKYFNPNYSYMGGHLYGFSPLESAWLSLQQDNESKNAGIEMLQNRGVRGVLAMKDWMRDASMSQMAKEQADLLRERWRQQNIEDKGGVIPVAGDANYVAVGLDMVALKILEIGGFTKDDLCNVYGVWAGLFNKDSTQTHDNVDQFRRDFIMNVVLPELNLYRSALNSKLSRDWGLKDSGLVVDYDSTVYVELQEDMKKLADWLQVSWWFTGNERRAFMNENESPEPMMNEILVPQNLIPLHDLNMDAIPLPETGLEDE